MITWPNHSLLVGTIKGTILKKLAQQPARCALNRSYAIVTNPGAIYGAPSVGPESFLRSLPYKGERERFRFGKHRQKLIIVPRLRHRTIPQCRTNRFHIMTMRCTVCRHQQRKEIDAALPHASDRGIAGRFNLKHSAVERHRKAHLLPQLARAAKRAELNAERLVVDLVENHVVTMEQRDDAIAARDRRATAALVREVRANSELLGRIVGAAWAGPVTVRVENNVQAVLMTKSVEELEAIVHALTTSVQSSRDFTQSAEVLNPVEDAVHGAS